MIGTDWKSDRLRLAAAPVRRLKYVARVVMGQSPPSEEYNSRAVGLPFLQGNAEFGNENPAPRLYTPSPPKTAEKGDLLISIRAPVGALNIADQTYGIGRGLCAVRPSASLDRRFLWYALRACREQLNALATGSTYDAVSAADLGNLVLPIPPRATQVNIAESLDREWPRFNSLHSRKLDLHHLVNERAACLTRNAVLRGLKPNLETVDSGIPWIGCVPQHWDIARLKHVARLESGHTPSRTNPDYWTDCTIPWITLNDLGRMANTMYLTETANYISEKGLAGSSARVLPPGTVVLSRDATVGRVSILGKSMATSQHFVNWICDGAVLLPKYLYWVLGRGMQSELKSLVMGSTIGTIGMPEVRDFHIPLPPLNEQREIAEYCEVTEKKAREASRALVSSAKLLIEYRDSLVASAVVV